MKARIKLVEKTFNREIRSGDIVDIEIYGEPKAVSPDLGMEEDSLHERISKLCLGISGGQVCAIEKEAKEYFQKNPDEICTHVSIWKKQYDELWKEWKKVEKNYQGMVSIDSVLEVFDESIDDIPAIRKVIEDMKG